MTFEFIDNNNPVDSAARKRIRSHVATGKNLGKTLTRPSKRNALKQGVKTVALLHAPRAVKDSCCFGTPEEQEGKQDERVPKIERLVGDVLSVVSFPEEQGWKARCVVQRAFAFISGPRHAPELSDAVDASHMPTSPWVQFMFLDEAYFHCAVATSVTALNQLLITQEDPKEAMRHLSLAFRLINEKLSGDGAVSDTTMAVVVIMAQHERLQGHYRQGLVHVDGLERMVELRGGIRELGGQAPSLAQKIFRLDLEYALHLGETTRFGLEDIVPNCTAMLGFSDSSAGQGIQALPDSSTSQLVTQLSTDIHNLLVDVTCLAQVINDACAGNASKLNEYTYHDTLLLLGYRLIAISPLSKRILASRLENAIHLGIAVFLATLLRGLDRRIPNIPLLSGLVRSAAREDFDYNREEQEALLWMLFIGSTPIFRRADDIWLIPKTIRTMNALDVSSWEDVSRVLGRFPWVNNVHDKAGQGLWIRTTSGCV